MPADLRLRLQTRDRLARVLDLSERLARSSTAPASQVAALRASIFATAHLYEQATREGSPYAFERLVQSVEQHALSAQKLWETARMSTPQRSRTLHLENERRRMEGLPSFAAEPLEDITGSRYAVLDVPAVESWQDFAEVAQAKHADQLAALHQTDGTTLDIRPMGLLPELARTDAPPLRWSEPAEPAQPTALGQEQMHGLKTLAQLETTDERNLVERMTALLEGATGSGELNHSLHQLGELRPGPRKMLVPRSGPLTRRYALALCSPAARKSLELRAEMGRVSAELVALAEASEDPQRVALAEQLHGLLSNPGAAASAMLADFQRFDAGHGLPPSLTEDGSAHHYAPAAARFEAGAVKNALEQLRAGYQGLRWFPPAEVRPQPPEVEVAEARLEAALARITALPPNDTGVVGLEDDWTERFGSEVADARSNYAEARSLGDPLALARFTRDAENLERISELLDLTRRADIAAVPL